MPRNGPETSSSDVRATDRRLLLRGAGIGSAAMALSLLPGGGGLLSGAVRADDQRVSDFDILNFALNPAPPWFPRPRT